MGWLRDYLWFNSSQLINGYSPLGVTKNAIFRPFNLGHQLCAPSLRSTSFGHLVWSTGFMFLISWRGYWQELIESIVWAHEQTPLANLIVWSEKPVALSIVQARFVGLAQVATFITHTSHAPSIARRLLIAHPQMQYNLPTQRTPLREILTLPSLIILYIQYI